MLRTEQIINTVEMIQKENLDVRTVTLGLNLMDCRDSDGNAVARKVYDKVVRFAGKLVPTCNAVGAKYGLSVGLRFRRWQMWPPGIPATPW